MLDDDYTAESANRSNFRRNRSSFASAKTISRSVAGCFVKTSSTRCCNVALRAIRKKMSFRNFCAALEVWPTFPKILRMLTGSFRETTGKPCPERVRRPLAMLARTLPSRYVITNGTSRIVGLA